jgi:hypothetical protein
MKLPAKLGIGAGVLFAALQAIPVDRTNPPVTHEIQAPADVKAILKRACWDCHSNETKWPWYAHVAPASFVVRMHVVDGRKHLNFSEWGGYPPERRAKKQKECGEEVAEGAMPLPPYLALHPEARLSDADKKVLEAWANGPVSE